MLHLLPLLAAAANGGATYPEDYAYTFYKLSSAAYCATDKIESWSCAPCVASNQTLTSIRTLYNVSTDTRCFVASYRDKYTQDMSIVVSFRGTVTLENWIEDLNLAKTDADMSCDGCKVRPRRMGRDRDARATPRPPAPNPRIPPPPPKVHSGFLNSWKPVAHDVLYEVERLQNLYPGAKLYTTGHSLGAALATLAAYVLEYDNGLKVEGVYTFGQPRVGNKEFSTFYNANSATHVTWRVTHHRDIVPHLPPKLIGFHHVSRAPPPPNHSRASRAVLTSPTLDTRGRSGRKCSITAVSAPLHTSCATAAGRTSPVRTSTSQHVRSPRPA